MVPDRIVLFADGAATSMTLEDYSRIPLPVRVRHLLASQFRFFAGDQEIDATRAMKAILEITKLRGPRR